VRKAFSRQQRLDCPSIGEVELNLECRHELIPILKGVQHIYSCPELRDRLLNLIGQDVNEDSRTDCGREGFDYWQVLVLAAVRLGCNLDYDQLQDLAEQHRKLRQIMGVGEWDAFARAIRQKETVLPLNPAASKRAQPPAALNVAFSAGVIHGRSLLGSEKGCWRFAS